MRNKPTLKEVYGQPLYGLKTGLNAAFVIDKATRNDIIKQNPQSLDCLKPFLEGKDLKKWRAESRHLYLILFPKGWTRKQMGKASDAELSEEKAWSWLKKQHSALCEWLEPFAEKGRKRGDKGEFWWELRACAYYDEFRLPKIVYNRFMPEPLFWLDTQGILFNNALNLLPKVSFFELGILNSSVTWFYLSDAGSAMSGGFFQVHAHVLERAPIAIATDSQKQVIAQLAENCQTLAASRYKMQDAFRRRILDLCPPDKEAKLSNKLKSWWELDFSEYQKEVKSRFKYTMTLKESMEWEPLFDEGRQKIQQYSYQLASKEAELNKAVYELFGLDADEIMLLEQNLK